MRHVEQHKRGNTGEGDEQTFGSLGSGIQATVCASYGGVNGRERGGNPSRQGLHNAGEQDSTGLQGRVSRGSTNKTFSCQYETSPGLDLRKGSYMAAGY